MVDVRDLLAVTLSARIPQMGDAQRTRLEVTSKDPTAVI
jgi:hypothetical protein